MTFLRATYSSLELANLLDLCPQTITRYARIQKWQQSPRKGRGGGREWFLSSLPETFKRKIHFAHACRHAAEFVCKQVSQPVNISGQQNNLAGLPEHGQSKAMARAIIARAALHIQQETEKDAASVHHELSKLIAKREAPVPEWVYQHVRKASRSAIRDWTVKLQREGIRRLGKGHEKRRPRNLIDNTPKLQDFVLGMLYEFPHVSAAEIERGLIARFGPEGAEEDLSIKLPCLRRIQIWLKKWKRTNAALLLAHENPDAARSRNKVAFGELQKICDQWAEHVYGNEPHSGLDGMTPNEKAAAYGGTVRRIEDERALDVLLSPCPGGNGLRMVTKKGIRVTSKQHGLTIKGHYIGTDLATLVGRQVLVRLDEDKLGVAYLFDPETGEYLGKAEHPGWLGWSAEDVRNVAVASAHKQKADPRPYRFAPGGSPASGMDRAASGTEPCRARRRGPDPSSWVSAEHVRRLPCLSAFFL